MTSEDSELNPILEKFTCDINDTSSGLWFNYTDISKYPCGYQNIFSQLICNQNDFFFQSLWEKKAAIFKRSAFKYVDSDLEILENHFSKQQLVKIINENSLSYLNNVKIMKYESHNRKEMEISDQTVSVKSKIIEKAFKSGYTIQFFQPQRFSKFLQTVNAGFEFVFGNLAGSSSYLTPPSVQGLAPHYDDIEAFIIQTEGSKLWRLWKNPSLPDTPSNDIPRESLSNDFVEVILNAGDVLYMPRGTIHEAVALNAFSTHITVSLYQQFHMKMYCDTLFLKLLEDKFDSDIELRQGLPIYMSEKFGTWVNSKFNDFIMPKLPSGIVSTGKSFQANGYGIDSSNIIEYREQFLLKVKEKLLSISENVTLDDLDAVTDNIIIDFVKNRLSPPNIAVASIDDYKPFNAFNCSKSKRTPINKAKSDGNIKIKICHPRSYHCIITESTFGAKMIGFSHSRFHSNLKHMDHPEEADDFEENNVEDEEEYTVCIPLRMSPVVHLLEESYQVDGISLEELKNICHDEFRIFADEVGHSISKYSLWKL